MYEKCIKIDILKKLIFLLKKKKGMLDNIYNIINKEYLELNFIY